MSWEFWAQNRSQTPNFMPRDLSPLLLELSPVICPLPTFLLLNLASQPPPILLNSGLGGDGPEASLA